MEILFNVTFFDWIPSLCVDRNCYTYVSDDDDDDDAAADDDHTYHKGETH
jgi:hypothetical protein